MEKREGEVKHLYRARNQQKNMPELVTIQDVYEALKRIEEKMVTRGEVEALIDSVEILNNPKTMKALRKSDQDVEAGRVKEVTSVKELLDEL